jgi:hypothetical protein
VVRVVVVHADAAGLPAELESTAGTTKLCEQRLGLLPSSRCAVDRLQGRCGVLPVVVTRNGELEVHGGELVAPHDLGDRLEPPLELRLELGGGGERRVVVELDVRDDRDVGGEREDAPVRLVSLDHEPSVTRARVSAELRHLAADQERGVEPEPVEAEGDHRRRGGLAVRSGHDDRAPVRHELGEELRPRHA